MARILTSSEVKLFLAQDKAEIEYLKAEVELLKKLELQERQVKKGINVKIIWGSRCICVK